MIASLDNSALLKHHYNVGIFYGGKPAVSGYFYLWRKGFWPLSFLNLWGKGAEISDLCDSPGIGSILSAVISHRSGDKRILCSMPGSGAALSGSMRCFFLLRSP